MIDKRTNPRARRNILEGRDDEVVKAIEDNKGNISAAARVVGVTENAIYHWMDRKGKTIEIQARVVEAQPQV